MKKRVLIIGGGVAGMYLCERLSAENYDITMLESGSRPGGRCNSFIDKFTGETIDNGQHLLMGAYTNFLEFIDRIGAKEQIGTFPGLSIPFISTKGTSYLLDDKNLGGKIGMLAAMLSAKHFSAGDRLKFVRLMLKVSMLNANNLNMTAAEFLLANNQSNKLMNDFWTPLVLAVLNTTPTIAPAKLLIAVLKKAFFANANAAKMMYVKTDFNCLFNRFMDTMKERNTEVRLNARVNRILIQNGRAIGVELGEGEILRADCVISAVPHYALQKLLPSDALTMPNLKNLMFYKNSSILSAYLWYKEEIDTPAMLGLLDSSMQWLFNRRKLQEQDYVNYGYKSSFAITISSSEANNELSKYELIENFAEELADAMPQFKGKTPAHYRIIKEKRATFEANTEIEKYRVNQITPIPNFYVCGDWTKTDLPATIEGAALSAEIVYKDLVSKYLSE